MTDPQRTESDRKAIDRVRDAHVVALNAGDAPAWAAQFAEDGVQMPPNGPANVGRTAIETWSGAFLGQFRVSFGLVVDEMRLLGDWALERGTYTIDLELKSGGPPMHDVGKYITIYQKAPGSGWLMARDIWNSDNPAPA